MDNFIDYYIKKTKRYFKKNSKARIIVALLMIAAIALLSVSIFLLTRSGLESTQIGDDPFMPQAAPLYIYQIFLLIVGLLIFASTVIFTLFSFFNRDNLDHWIMATPRYDTLSWVKFFRALIDSSWPLIILAIPLLLAVKSVFEISFGLFLFTLLVVVAFSLFCSASAVVLIFLISSVMRKMKIKSFSILAFTIVAVTALLGAVAWSRTVAMDINQIFQIAEGDAATLDAMKSNFAVLPSHFPAMTLHYVQTEKIGAALMPGGLTFALFLAVVFLFSIIKKKFLYFWQVFQEGSFEAKAEREVKKSPLSGKKFPRTPEQVIFKKERLNSIRSPKNIFWFSFLFILMLVQVGVINLLERYVGIAGPEAVSGLTSAIQLGVIIFFTAALILRFIFPSFSQEGNTSWLIGSTPIDLKTIFNTKYLFYCLVLVPASILAVILYAVPLAGGSEALLLILFAVVGVLTLTMLGLSMGVVFVNFETDDPQKLSTSAPGIGFTLISLIYGGATAVIIDRILTLQNPLPIFFFLLLSFLIYKISKSKALRSLDDMEFV